MLSVQPSLPVAVHSAECQQCTSINVVLLTQDPEDKCLAEIEIIDTNKVRQVCFGDSWCLMSGYICLECGHRERVTSYKEVKGSLWYRFLGTLNVDFTGIIHTLEDHRISEPGFSCDFGGATVVFNGGEMGACIC